MEPREFSIYCGTGEKCMLKGTGLQAGHHFEDITRALDFILTLELPKGSILTAYSTGEVMFRIPLLA